MAPIIGCQHFYNELIYGSNQESSCTSFANYVWYILHLKEGEKELVPADEFANI